MTAPDEAVCAVCRTGRPLHVHPLPSWYPGRQILLCPTHGSYLPQAGQRAKGLGETIPEAITGLCTHHPEAAHAHAFSHEAEVRSIVGPGTCYLCERPVPDAMWVAVIERGSGPVYGVEACAGHARELAAIAGAPAWLRHDVAELDARAQEEARPLHLSSGEAS